MISNSDFNISFISNCINIINEIDKTVSSSKIICKK